MAIFNGLRFGNVNSLDYGIYITGEAIYNAPERDVEMVEIAGRNGALTLDKGRWKNIEVTYTAGTFGDDQTDFATKVRNFRNALTSQLGYVRLSDTYNDNEYRLGVFKSVFEVDAVSYKRAGEFQIVFDCKPQRFLMSGEASQDITSGQDLYNSTGYDAQPLIMVEGYGTLNLGDYKITLTDEVFGSVTLASATQINAQTNEITLLKGRMDVGNPFHIDLELRVSCPTAGTAENFAVTTNISEGTPAVTVYDYGNTLIFNVDYSADFVWETDKSISGTFDVTCDIGGIASTAMFRMNVQYSSQQDTITVEYGKVTSSSLITGGVNSGRISDIVGESTAHMLGEPTIVDCEIGEAYKVVDGEYVSLNRYIDLGSKVPVLKGGSNVITFDNTITSLKVAPKWWIL